ncbi:Trinucleotide Repeat-Containing 18 Protein [Manis pentadactyla]|nr:Trinucleotide Repeat-Containing 18 Protein [Manis pentadactyla]
MARPSVGSQFPPWPPHRPCDHGFACGEFSPLWFLCFSKRELLKSTDNSRLCRDHHVGAREEAGTAVKKTELS